MFKHLTLIALCMAVIVVPMVQPVCMADGGAVAGALGAGAAGAGGGGAVGISAAVAAGISAAAAAAVVAGALSGDDSGIGVLGIATTGQARTPDQPGGQATTSHESAPPYRPIITPSHVTPSSHSTPTH